MIRSIFAALAAVCVLSACDQHAGERQSAFSGRVADWTAEMLADSPESATSVGVGEDVAGRGFEARLDDRSPLAEERRRTAALRRDVELGAIDTATLTAEEKITYDALREQFSAAADLAQFTYGDFTPLDGAEPYVVTQSSGAYLSLPDFFDGRQHVRSLADADAFLARLRAVPAALDGEGERVRADAAAGVIAPDFVLDRTLASLDSVIGTAPGAQIYVTALRDNLATIEGADARRVASLVAEAETITRERIIPAHQRLAATLRAVRPRATHDAGVWRLPNGAAYYAALLRFHTTTTLSPDEIHTIGTARVAALTRELDVAVRRLGKVEGTVGQRLAAMTADPQYQYAPTDEGRAQLLTDVRGRVDRVMQLAPRWFSHLPRAALEVRRVPEIAEGASSGAYYEPPALDGSSPGIYYINMRSLAEMTRIDLPTQDYHEAVPGHHFQIALAREREDLPLLRRLLSFAAYSEGWALYAEQLADEQGMYERDPVGRIGYLRWQLWRAARLVVDTGIHAKRWSREQAIDYLAQTTGDTPGVIVSEVERYVVSPGQACAYELGRREIATLRDEARNALGADFDLKGFHDAVLAEGELPFAPLDARVRAWIAETAR